MLRILITFYCMLFTYLFINYCLYQRLLEIPPLPAADFLGVFCGPHRTHRWHLSRTPLRVRFLSSPGVECLLWDVSPSLPASGTGLIDIRARIGKGAKGVCGLSIPQGRRKDLGVGTRVLGVRGSVLPFPPRRLSSRAALPLASAALPHCFTPEHLPF